MAGSTHFSHALTATSIQIIVALTAATAAHGEEQIVSLLLTLKHDELLRVQQHQPPPGSVPPRPLLFTSLFTSPAPWHTGVTSTEFWIGERATRNDPGNCSSAWVHDWKTRYGGVDNPAGRRGFLPIGFIPRQNPFYVALPYNDIEGGHTKTEAAQIPWFKETYIRNGRSVCHGHWVAVRAGNNRIAYARWADVGPFRTDCFSYVFGTAPPAWNKNNSAGIDLAPAVIDYLNLRAMDVVDWRFMDYREVPPGPWSAIPNTRVLALKN